MREKKEIKGDLKFFDLSSWKYVVTLTRRRKTVVRAGLLRKKRCSILVILSFQCLFDQWR